MTASGAGSYPPFAQAHWVRVGDKLQSMRIRIRISSTRPAIPSSSSSVISTLSGPARMSKRLSARWEEFTITDCDYLGIKARRSAQ